MKRIIFSLILLFAAGSIFAQSNNAVNNYFSDHAQNEEFTKITISQGLFQLANHVEVETEEEKEFQEAVSKIEGMIILVCDSCAGNERSMYDESNGRLPSSYAELMLVEDKDVDVRFTIRENNGVINEMLISVGGDDVFALIDIWGEIDLKNIHKLTEAFDVQAMKSFDPKTAVASRSVNYYPNPVREGKNANLELPTDLIGTQVKIYDVSGHLIKDFTANSSRIDVPTSDLSQGTYILNLHKDNKRFYSERFMIVK